MELDAARAIDLTEVILGNLHREVPGKIAHVVLGDGDVAMPRALTPIFYGCFDWHSAVHSHWALVRLRARVDSERGAAIDRALAQSFDARVVAGELRYLEARPGFELPYGLAWLLTLAGELRVGDATAAAWATTLAPLVAMARHRLAAWVARLPAPIRSGEHSQSAFALALAWDWAGVVGDAELRGVIAAAAERWHADDRDAPFGWEPSAWDFLSPALGVAWLMARVRDPDSFARWLDGFAPRLGRGAVMAPVIAADRADGKLVHWDGLNLSRAFMLSGLEAALPAADRRRGVLAAMALSHGRHGLAALAGASYAGSHWLPSFATYWLTGPLRPSR